MKRARYLKSEVAEEEDACDKSVLLARDSQLLVHRQCRECNVGPVDKVNYEENENKWNDPRSQFSDYPGLNIGWKECRIGSHAHLDAS